MRNKWLDKKFLFGKDFKLICTPNLMFSMGKRLAVASLALGLALTLDQKVNTAPAAQAQEFSLQPADHSKQALSPIFSGSWNGAVDFMFARALTDLTEDGYLYVPSRGLLFDIGIEETPTHVRWHERLESRICSAYQEETYRAHIHLDTYNLKILQRILDSIEQRQESKNVDPRGSFCYDILANPGTASACKKRLDRVYKKQYDDLLSLKSCLKGLSTGGRRQNPIYKAYIPSFLDFQNLFMIKRGNSDQRNFIVIVGNSGKPTAVSFAVGKPDWAWYFNELEPYTDHPSGFTKRRMERFLSEAKLHGFFISQSNPGE